MIWWRPPHEWRRTRKHWTFLLKPGFEPGGIAAETIKRCFGVFIPELRAANDRDHIRW